MKDTNTDGSIKILQAHNSGAVQFTSVLACSHVLTGELLQTFRKHHAPSTLWEVSSPKHGVMSQNTWTLSNIADRIWTLATALFIGRSTELTQRKVIKNWNEVATPKDISRAQTLLGSKYFTPLTENHHYSERCTRIHVTVVHSKYN